MRKPESQERAARRSYACRIVAYSVALGLINRDSQDQCDSTYLEAMGLDLPSVKRWAEDLEAKCRTAGRLGVLSFATLVELGAQHGFDFGREPK